MGASRTCTGEMWFWTTAEVSKLDWEAIVVVGLNPGGVWDVLVAEIVSEEAENPGSEWV